MADVVPEDDSVPDVLTEVQSGDALSLAAAGRLFPGHRGGAAVDPSTVFRWLTKGARGPAGRLVRLEAVRTPGRWLTSRAAVARFVAALTAAADPASLATTPAATPNPAARRKSSERANSELARRGA